MPIKLPEINKMYVEKMPKDDIYLKLSSLSAKSTIKL